MLMLLYDYTLKYKKLINKRGRNMKIATAVSLEAVYIYIHTHTDSLLNNIENKYKIKIAINLSNARMNMKF